MTGLIWGVFAQEEKGYRRSDDDGGNGLCESINAGFGAPTILIDYATTAQQPLSHRRRGGRSFCISVKGKPMPFDTDDVGHLYELIAAFDSVLHSNAMHRRVS
ncbi:hypothetical protein EAG_08418 [Camponotus floridanus]|uniref:Uncharacterized protein n=1 Tax=Camponotus floridanus TaxID=104421 RepID=E1ZYT1_CAMFO|nr:hypothetical protein EAG_08418 [Camponotus floridanus]